MSPIYKPNPPARVKNLHYYIRPELFKHPLSNTGMIGFIVIMFKIKGAIKMVKLGWALTAYLFLSFILFLSASNTIAGGIIYLFILLPFYGIVLLGAWLFIGRNRTKTARIKYRIWIIVLALQVATILVSPGDCYGFKQGDRCYSNLQILISGRNLPHWKLVEDAFLGFVLAYGVAVVVALFSTSFVKNIDHIIDQE